MLHISQLVCVRVFVCVCRCLLRVCMCIFSVCGCLCFRHCLLRYHFAGRSLVFINKYFLTVANWPCFFFDSVFFSAFASFFLSKSLCTDCSGCECVCVRESGQLPNLIIIKKKDELISLKKEICLCVLLYRCVCTCVCVLLCVPCVSVCVSYSICFVSPSYKLSCDLVFKLNKFLMLYCFVWKVHNKL